MQNSIFVKIREFILYYYSFHLLQRTPFLRSHVVSVLSRDAHSTLTKDNTEGGPHLAELEYAELEMTDLDLQGALSYALRPLLEPTIITSEPRPSEEETP